MCWDDSHTICSVKLLLAGCMLAELLLGCSALLHWSCCKLICSAWPPGVAAMACFHCALERDASEGCSGVHSVLEWAGSDEGLC